MVGHATVAYAQSRVEVRGPTTLLVGRASQFEVQLVTIGMSVRRITDAAFTTTCGTVDSSGTFHAPDVGGTCVLRASVRGPDGQLVVGATTIRIIEATAAPTAPASRTRARRRVADEPQAAPQAPPHRDELPQFPWPPPPATARLAIAHRLLTGLAAAPAEGDRLGDIADRIEQALGNAGLEHAVYAIGDSGFAYVTRVEMIRANGDAVPPPDRFPSDATAAEPRHGFLDFILSRFRARPGFYRVIAIVVTTRAITSGTTSLTVDEATRLANGGMATLPAVLRNLVVRDLDFAALVYEFGRPSVADSVVFRAAPLVPAREHLVRAGLWSMAELQGTSGGGR